MRTDIARRLLVTAAVAGIGANLGAAPITYQIDPNHTYPAFEADHLGGLSILRGKINATVGSVTVDREAETGSVAVTMEMDSIDFGHDQLTAHAKTADMFDVANYPTASYVGTLTNFVDGAPTSVEGTLTLHGVTLPVNLTIEQFLCKMHPQLQRPACGADALATIDRSDFGINFGQGLFDMGVTLRISIEAIQAGE